MARVFVGLGSNEGDRLANLSGAVQRLGGLPTIRVVQMATIYETKPVGLPAPCPLPGIYYVYVMKCEDDSLYIGQTDDLVRRWQDHFDGRIDWTVRHRPLEIVHFETVSTREEAVKREQQLKTGYGRTWLRRLIKSGRARQAGGPPQENFLNSVVELETTLSPQDLLKQLKRLEQQLGRTPSRDRWAPRPIDLDILLYDDRVIQEAQLVIPHAQMHLRRFVLEPLAQLAPHLRHPVLGQTIAELMAKLPAAPSVAGRGD